MRPAFTLQNGDEIYEVSVYGDIYIVHVKQVKIDGLVVTARIVDERYRYNSNLIVGHKNSNIILAEDSHAVAPIGVCYSILNVSPPC